MICSGSGGTLYVRLPEEKDSGNVKDNDKKVNLLLEAREFIWNLCTKMFVLHVWQWVSINALLHTLRSLRTPTRRTASIHMMLTGSDGVGSAACNTQSPSVHLQQHRLNPASLYWTYQLWSHTSLRRQALCWPRIPKQQRESHQNSWSTHENTGNILRQIKRIEEEKSIQKSWATKM